MEEVRRRLGQTVACAARLDLAAMRPRPGLSSTAYCLASEGREYLVYQPEDGAFDVDVIDGTYDVEWFDAAAGTTVSAEPVRASNGRATFAPPAPGEAVLHLTSRATNAQ